MHIANNLLDELFRILSIQLLENINYLLEFDWVACDFEDPVNARQADLVQ
jgi:hypothetical protein